MDKKYFAYPYILLTRGGIGEGGQPEPEVGSAHGTPDAPYPCSYANWVQLFGADLNWSDAIDFADYQIWWTNNHFTLDQWTAAGNSASDFPNP